MSEKSVNDASPTASGRIKDEEASLPNASQHENTVVEPGPVDEATKRRLHWQLDIRIIPMVMWIYLMNMMDRVNIGNGRLFGLEEDLNLVGGQFQIAVSALFITYCLFETPSNFIIKRLQPARYLAGLTFVWGIVATFTAFVNNFAALIVCRLLLGLFEAGLFPGVVLYLTMFYGKRSIAMRIAYFFATSAFSGIAGGLVAYGISFMDGTAGWRAWRWIILINGIPTIITGLAVPFVLPNSPETAKFLSEQDRRDLLLMREQEVGRARNARELVWSDVQDGFKDWTMYLYCLIQYCINNMLYSFSIFLPTIIHGLGNWTPAQVQAFTVPVYSAGAFVYLMNARLSDITQKRGVFAMGAISTSIFGYCLLIANHNIAMSYAGTFFVAMGLYSCGGIMLAWLTVNNPRYGKRATQSGMQLTIGNAAGVASPFIFENQYAPTYYPGYGATIGLLVLGCLMMAVLHFHFKRVNKKRRAGKEDWKLEGKTEDEIAELGDRHPRFMFTT